MRIFFIRHGETTGDVEDRYGGVYDDHLSERGVTQSEAVGASLKDSGIQIIFSSPLVRAKETSAILARAIGNDVAVSTHADLQERNQYAALSGMMKAEAKEKYPDLVEALQNRLNTIEGAESYTDFSNRVTRGFEYIVESLQDSPSKTIGIVWHGGPMRVLFRDILKRGELKTIGDCSFVELEKDDGDWIIKNSDGIVFDFEQ